MVTHEIWDLESRFESDTSDQWTTCLVPFLRSRPCPPTKLIPFLLRKLKAVNPTLFTHFISMAFLPTHILFMEIPGEFFALSPDLLISGRLRLFFVRR